MIVHNSAYKVKFYNIKKNQQIRRSDINMVTINYRVTMVQYAEQRNTYILKLDYIQRRCAYNIITNCHDNQSNEQL